MEPISYGIIGGSGVYELPGAEVLNEVRPETPYGLPSDVITIARVNGQTAAFLPRHGRGHRYLPSEVPYRANIFALKSLGVHSVIAVSAVGSLREDIRPTDIVMPEQIIDRTRGRDHSFFGGGMAGHIAFADPFCGSLRGRLEEIIRKLLQSGGHSNRLFTRETYLCMEGPQFSTRAESRLYKSWGCGVIGMTAVPEAKLAREAGMCYALLAMPTDYDSWRETESGVELSEILSNMKQNNAMTALILPLIIGGPVCECVCGCREAARNAVMTARDIIPRERIRELSTLFGSFPDENR